MSIRNRDKVNSLNSTIVPLPADGAFQGVWEFADYDQVAVSVFSSTDGTLFIEVGVPSGPGEITVTLTRTVPIYAGVPFYHPLVKGAARAYRLRFENGPVSQDKFLLSVSYGDNLTVSTATTDNELLVTVTERERDRYVTLRFTDVIADEYTALIDLSDNVAFPHDRIGSVDLTNTYLLVDRDASTTGSTRIGVVTRIDETSADIEYVSGVTFEKSDERKIIRDRKFSPSALKCAVENGTLKYILTDFTELGVTAVNTLTPLRSPLGPSSVTPAVGDIVVKAEHLTGSYNASVSVMYHSER